MFYLLLFLSFIIMISLYFDYKDEKFCNQFSLKLKDVKTIKVVIREFIILKTSSSDKLSISCYVNSIDSSNNLIAYWEFYNNKVYNFKLMDYKSFKLLKERYKSWNPK